jgi:hypothetical protein
VSNDTVSRRSVVGLRLWDPVRDAPAGLGPVVSLVDGAGRRVFTVRTPSGAHVARGVPGCVPYELRDFPHGCGDAPATPVKVGMGLWLTVITSALSRFTTSMPALSLLLKMLEIEGPYADAGRVCSSSA